MDQKAYDRRLSIAIFAGGLPFYAFDRWRCPSIWEFIHELNSAYKIPERYRIANELLP